MAVEGADWPNELDINDPANTDDPTEGAEELRQLKRVIVNMLGTDPGLSIADKNVFEALYQPGQVVVTPDSAAGDPTDDLPGTWSYLGRIAIDDQQGASTHVRVYQRSS
jgi:hypothetical protein